MARRPVEVSLYATPERARKFREGIIEPRETESAGNVIATGQRELQECALDVLYRNGHLSRSTDRKDEARWRFNAGYWLRELYLKTHPTNGVGAYSLRLEGLGGFISRPVSEAEANDHEDAENWNFKCLQDTIKSMGKHWRILEQVCCEDCALGRKGPILDALDALFEHRGGYISDYLASFEKVGDE